MSKEGDLPRAEAPPKAGEIVEISDLEFSQLTALLEECTGLHLPPSKKPLLAARLSERMRALGLASFAEYHRRVSGDAGELARMTDAVSTNETRFFRDTEQIELIERTVIPALLLGAPPAGAPRRLRVWSAGCSTGEEALTIAMLLLARLPQDRFTIEVLGTDISGAALEQARAARWPAHRLAEVPEAYRARFFEQGRAPGEVVPSRDLRSVVRFQRLNLWDVYYPPMGRFDMILCRNVLIYFDVEARAAVVRRLVERLAPRGLLFLGMTESLLALRDGSMRPQRGRRAAGSPPRLRSVGPAVYAREEEPGRELLSQAGPASSRLLRPPPGAPTASQRKFWNDPLTAWRASLTWALSPRRPR